MFPFIFGSKPAYKGSSHGLHLVERYTRVDEDTVIVETTIDDPTTWTNPWTVRITGNWEVDTLVVDVTNWGEQMQCTRQSKHVHSPPQ